MIRMCCKTLKTRPSPSSGNTSPNRATAPSDTNVSITQRVGSSFCRCHWRNVTMASRVSPAVVRYSRIVERCSSGFHLRQLRANVLPLTFFGIKADFPREPRLVQEAFASEFSAAARSLSTSESNSAHRVSLISSIGSGCPFTMPSKNLLRSAYVGRLALAHGRSCCRIAASRAYASSKRVGRFVLHPLRQCRAGSRRRDRDRRGGRDGRSPGV